METPPFDPPQVPFFKAIHGLFTGLPSGFPESGSEAADRFDFADFAATSPGLRRAWRRICFWTIIHRLRWVIFWGTLIAIGWIAGQTHHQTTERHTDLGSPAPVHTDQRGGTRNLVSP